jgi:hypothetical protein
MSADDHDIRLSERELEEIKDDVASVVSGKK